MVARRIDESPRYDYVPTELKQQKQWARYDIIDGRDKRPVNLDGSVMYWKKKPESKLTFEQVAPFDKIGCFATLESGIVKVDFDGCIDENGNIHPLVLSWIKNTYAEISPSRTGVKAWFKGTIPNGKAIIYNKDSKHFTEDVPWANPNNPHTGIEIYAQKRFFTVTGNVVTGCPSQINEAPDALHDMLTRFAPKPKEKKKAAPKENNKKSSREQDKFDAPDGFWSLETWKSWCHSHFEVHNEGDDYLDITCPWAHLHTTPGDSARVYFGPPHTFNCFHAHCDGREWRDVRLVYDPTAYDWQRKQSRSKEESIKHLPSYPEITMEEQEEILKQSALAIKQSIRDHMEANDGTALLLACPPGTGKTEISAQLVIEEKIDAAIMSPTHKVAYSTPSIRAIQHIQVCSDHNCDSPNLHAICGEKGYNTIRSIHKQHKCDFMFQFLTEGSKVYMQQYYKSRWPASHSLVINDEATLSDWLPQRRVTIPQLQKVTKYIDKYIGTDSDESHFLRAWQAMMTEVAQDKPVHGKPIFDQLDKNAQLTNWLGALMPKHANTLPSTGVNLENDELDEATRLHNKPDVILPHLIKALADELVKWQSGGQWNSRIQVKRDPSGEVATYITEPRQLVAPKGDPFPTFVHLDAYVDETIHKLLFGKEIKILRTPINPAPGMKHLGVRDDNFYGKTALTAVHKDGSPNTTLAATIKKAKYMLKKVNPDGSKKVALISHMDCVDQIAEALGLPEEQTGYYWNVRGSNNWEKCDILLLIGTPTLNPQTITTMARSLYFNDPEPICEEWTREDGYKDPRLKHLAQFLTSSELSQAAHRIRAIRHANKTVISFCEGEIKDLPITETYTSLPYMTEEGENLHETKKNEATDKIRVAYEELSKDGNRPTTEEVRKKACVGRNKVVEWMKENTEENKSTAGSMIIDYIEPAVLEIFERTEVPKGGQEPVNDIQHYHGIEKGEKVITPLGQGTVVLMRGIPGYGVRVTVSVDQLGWKSFKFEEVKPIIRAVQEPLLSSKTIAELDALFADIG